METKWHSSLLLAEDKAAVVSEEPLSMDRLLAQVAALDKGAVVTFSGTVRDLENGAPLSALRYEAYVSMAEQEIRKIIERTEKQWSVTAAVEHRIGRVPVGQAALNVACAGAHRQETFAACESLVEAIKKEVPIWKVGFEWA